MSLYWNYHDEISTSDGIMFKGERVIVPKGMQSEMLQAIHSSHLGKEKCKRRARNVLYWLGMNSQIETVVSNCATCNTYHTKEPLHLHPVSKHPWERVRIDIYELNSHTYLILVEYYSGFMKKCVTQEVNESSHAAKAHFAHYGIPDTLISDNGPHFSSEAFMQFAKDYQFKHHTSSPHYPQSNGMAEKAVQTVKNLIKKAMHDNKDIYLAFT